MKSIGVNHNLKIQTKKKKKEEKKQMIWGGGGNGLEIVLFTVQK